MTPAALDYVIAMVSSAREDFEAGELDRDSFAVLADLGIAAHQALADRKRSDASCIVRQLGYTGDER